MLTGTLGLSMLKFKHMKKEKNVKRVESSESMAHSYKEHRYTKCAEKTIFISRHTSSIMEEFSSFGEGFVPLLEADLSRRG